jgi:hypothetical protein
MFLHDYARGKRAGRMPAVRKRAIDGGCEVCSYGQQGLRIFPCDCQELQVGTLRFSRALFPTANRVGAYVQVQREEDLAGVQSLTDLADIIRAKCSRRWRQVCNTQIHLRASLVREGVSK